MLTESSYMHFILVVFVVYQKRTPFYAPVFAMSSVDGCQWSGWFRAASPGQRLVEFQVGRTISLAPRAVKPQHQWGLQSTAHQTESCRRVHSVTGTQLLVVYQKYPVLNLSGVMLVKVYQWPPRLNVKMYVDPPPTPVSCWLTTWRMKCTIN